MDEPGIRPGFWIMIIAAVVIVTLALLGYWEWAVVGLVAALVFGQVPGLYARRLLDAVTAATLIGLVLAGRWEWAVVGVIAALALRLLPFIRRRLQRRREDG